MDPLLSEILQEMRLDIKEQGKELAEAIRVLTEVRIGYHEHHRRSLSNEELVKITRQEAEEKMKAIQAQIEPLKNHVAAWGGVNKTLLVLGTIAGIVASGVALIKFVAG